MKRNIGRWAAAGVILATAGVWPDPVQAATAWDAGGGTDHSWFNADNWNAGVPDNTADITINNAAYQAVIDTGNADSKAFSLTAGSLTINSGRTWTVSALDPQCNVGSGFTVNIEGGTATGPASGWCNFSGTLNIRGGGLWSMSDYGYNYGTVNLGDTTTSGTYRTRQSRNESSSTIRGWGRFEYGGWADSWFNGKMIADGWGGTADRELVFAPFSNNGEWREGDNTTDKGWYAVNRAKLTLPGVAFSPSVTAQNWGEMNASWGFDREPDMVNSVNFSFAGITHSGSKYISGSLYARDHSEVPPYNPTPSCLIAGIWKFQPDTGFAFSGAVTNVFRYDHTAAAGREAELGLWRYENTRWINLATKPGYTVSVNTSSKLITATGFPDVDSLTGFFAAGAVMEPPRGGAAIVIQ